MLGKFIYQKIFCKIIFVSLKKIEMETLGNKLYDKTQNTRGALFIQGEMTQLTYISFEKNIEWVNSLDENATFPISYPLGYRADHTPIMSNPRNYRKEELTDRYKHLALNKLPIDSIFQLVTIIETMLNDIIRIILIEYPGKIPSKKQVDVSCILSSSSIEEIKTLLVDNILNEITYKSPKDYAAEFEKFTGVKLLESPAFHKYIELKATRDIHIHNRGIVNDIYASKAGILARVKNGEYLPVDIPYFLMSYEQCIQLTEYLETEFDKVWPSEEYRKRKEISNKAAIDEVVEKHIEEVKNEEDHP